MSEQTFLLILSTLLVVIIVAMMAFLSALLWQLVKILREVRGIVSNIRLGSDTLTEDLANLRSHLKSFFLGNMMSKFAGMRGGKRKTPPAGRTRDSSESQSLEAE